MKSPTHAIAWMACATALMTAPVLDARADNTRPAAAPQQAAAQAPAGPASKDKDGDATPRYQAGAAIGTTESGPAEGIVANFELPKDSSLDVTALAGQNLFRLQIGAEVVPVKIIRREIKGANGTVSYELAFVPQGELHIDVTSFKQSPDMHAFVTPAMESSIEIGGKRIQAKVSFSVSPAGMGAIHTDSGPVVTVGAQTGVGLELSFHISDKQTAEGGVETSLFKNWFGNSVKAIDLDGYLRYAYKVSDKPGQGSVVAAVYAGPVISWESMNIKSPAGVPLDADNKNFTGLVIGAKWW